MSFCNLFDKYLKIKWPWWLFEWLQLLNLFLFLADGPWSLFHYRLFLKHPLVRSIHRGRCYSENCFPWWLSVCLKCGWRPAGSLWRPLGLVCLCVFLLCAVHVCLYTCHVWPCVVCLQQYTFTVVFMAARQTSPESTVCLLSCFFLVLLQDTAAALCTLSLSLSFSLWVFNPLSDTQKAVNICVSVAKQYSKSMHAHTNQRLQRLVIKKLTKYESIRKHKSIFIRITTSIGCAITSSQLQSNVHFSQTIPSQRQHTDSLWTIEGHSNTSKSNQWVKLFQGFLNVGAK